VGVERIYIRVLDNSRVYERKNEQLFKIKDRPTRNWPAFGFFQSSRKQLSRLRHFIFVAMVLSLTWCDPWACPDNCPDRMEGRWKAWADRAGVQIPAYNPFQVKQNNLLPLPPGRTLIFERNESDTEGSFVCSACRKDFHTSDPAEGMAQFKLHKCESRRGRADG
jgi:hypothetical protein